LSTFDAAVGRFFDKMEKGIDEAYRKSVLETVTDLIHDSPRLTGTFQNSWRLAKNTPDLSVEEKPVKGTLPVPGAPEVVQFTHKDSIHITNNLPYAAILNDGRPGGEQHSEQAPIGWVETIAEGWPDSFEAHLEGEFS